MKFTKSIGYSERHRNGIAVASSVYKGERRVTIGPSWIKTTERDGTPVEPTPLFMRGTISLSPEAAESFANDILKAAEESRLMEVSKPEVKIKKSVYATIGQDVVKMILSGSSSDEIMQKVQQHFDTKPHKEINKQNNHHFNDEASQKAFDENILSSPEKLALFHELVNESGIEPDEALSHVLNANL